MSKTTSTKGVIEVVARNQKAFKLEGDEEWYTAFKATQLNGAEAGSGVEFEYEDNTRGGKTYHNIKGNVSITAEAPKTQTASGASVNNRELSMTRGGAVKAAAELVAAVGQYEGDVQVAAADVIAVAQLLEAYVLTGE